MDAISLQGPAQRVAFTADFFRCSVTGGRYRSSQARNAAWLREVVTGGLAWQRQSLELQTVFPAEGSAVAAAGKLGPAALAEYTAEAELAWARRYDSDKLVDFDACLTALGRADLVVGFELSPSLKRHLHRQQRPYISFHVHALRMLRDLCLGATTNDPAIAGLLAGVAVPDEEVVRQVRRFRALCAFHRVPALAFPAGLPVLIGQTARDSIIIEGGRFADWPDREDELAAALRGHDACVFIEHPFRSDSHKVCEYLRCRHGKAVIATNANGYGALLSTRDIPEVLTLSSSLGVEAQAFGLPTRFLLGIPASACAWPAWTWASTTPWVTACCPMASGTRCCTGSRHPPTARSRHRPTPSTSASTTCGTAWRSGPTNCCATACAARSRAGPGCQPPT